MKKLLEKGFTLIELLLVVVIIGILVVTTIAAINPVEQTKKGNDTVSVVLAGSINTSLIAFHGANQKYPFNNNPNIEAMVRWDYFLDNADPTPDLSSGLRNNIDVLASDLKASLLSRLATNNNIFVGNSTNREPIVCYVPKSGSARNAIVNGEYNGFIYKRLGRSGSYPSYTYTTGLADSSNCNPHDDNFWDANQATVCVLCNN